MKRYKVTPYYGFDCDSKNGFNNGHYLEEITVEAVDEFHASEAAIEKFCRLTKGFKNQDECEMFQADFGISTITGYYDNDGNELTKEQIEDMEGDEYTYRYTYVDFNKVDQVRPVNEVWLNIDLNKKEVENLNKLKERKGSLQKAFSHCLEKVLEVQVNVEKEKLHRVKSRIDGTLYNNAKSHAEKLNRSLSDLIRSILNK